MGTVYRQGGEPRKAALKGSESRYRTAINLHHNVASVPITRLHAGAAQLSYRRDF